jgi:thiol-disulfide isomerase/thioredoxin
MAVKLPGVSLSRGVMRGALVATAIACSLLTPRASLLAQDSGIEVGAQAPNAVLETLDGKPAELSKYIGKAPVVMEFWATWCPNCKALEPHLQAMHRKYGKQVQFVTVAVSINQSPALIKRYMARHAIPGDVLFDRKGNASGAYDVAATSFVVVVDRAGKVVYTGLGGKQNLEAIIKKTL